MPRVGDPPQPPRVEYGVCFYEGDPPNQWIRVADFTLDPEGRVEFFEQIKARVEERNAVSPGHLMPELVSRVLPPWQVEQSSETTDLPVEDSEGPFAGRHEVVIEVVLRDGYGKRLVNRRLVDPRMFHEALSSVLLSMSREVCSAIDRVVVEGKTQA